MGPATLRLRVRPDVEMRHAWPLPSDVNSTIRSAVERRFGTVHFQFSCGSALTEDWLANSNKLVVLGAPRRACGSSHFEELGGNLAVVAKGLDRAVRRLRVKGI